MAKKTNPAEKSSTDGAGFRRPYQQPSIVSRERLETAANVCSGFGTKSQPGEPSPDGGECGQVDIQS